MLAALGNQSWLFGCSFSYHLWRHRPTICAQHCNTVPGHVILSRMSSPLRGMERSTRIVGDKQCRKPLILNTKRCSVIPGKAIQHSENPTTPPNLILFRPTRGPRVGKGKGGHAKQFFPPFLVDFPHCINKLGWPPFFLPTLGGEIMQIQVRSLLTRKNTVSVSYLSTLPTLFFKRGMY